MDQEGVVYLSSATFDELQDLDGIGPAKAEKILELRQRGPLTHFDQLIEIKNFGHKTIEKLKRLGTSEAASDAERRSPQCVINCANSRATRTQQIDRLALNFQEPPSCSNGSSRSRSRVSEPCYVPPSCLPRDAPLHELEAVASKNLRVVFEKEHLRAHQQQACRLAFEGRNMVLDVETGAGKSLSWQLPAVCTTGVTLVIAPLNAITADQVPKLKELGIRAYAYNCEASKQQIEELIDALKGLPDSQTSILLYITSVSLIGLHDRTDGSVGQRLHLLLKNLHNQGLLTRVVVDEAHLVLAERSRCDYDRSLQLLPSLRESYPDGLFTLLSGSLDRNEVEQLITRFSLDPVEVISHRTMRPNMKFEVVGRRNQSWEDLAQQLNYNYRGASVLIYCHTCAMCEAKAAWLREQGIQAAHYHSGSGSTAASKKQTLQDWQDQRIQVLVGTTALGHGVDNQHVRMVVSTFLPDSLSHLWQQLARAGRDGRSAHCVVWYSRHDLEFHRVADKKKLRSEQQKQAQEHQLQAIEDMCEDTWECRQRFCLLHFDPAGHFDRCGRCDNCRRQQPPTAPDEPLTPYQPLNVSQGWQCWIVVAVLAEWAGCSYVGLELFTMSKVTATILMVWIVCKILLGTWNMLRGAWRWCSSSEVATMAPEQLDLPWVLLCAVSMLSPHITTDQFVEMQRLLAPLKQAPIGVIERVSADVSLWVLTQGRVDNLDRLRLIVSQRMAEDLEAGPEDHGEEGFPSECVLQWRSQQPHAQITVCMAEDGAMKIKSVTMTSESSRLIRVWWEHRDRLVTLQFPQHLRENSLGREILDQADQLVCGRAFQFLFDNKSEDGVHNWLLFAPTGATFNLLRIESSLIYLSDLSN